MIGAEAPDAGISVPKSPVVDSYAGEVAELGIAAREICLGQRNPGKMSAGRIPVWKRSVGEGRRRGTRPESSSG